MRNRRCPRNGDGGCGKATGETRKALHPGRKASLRSPETSLAGKTSTAAGGRACGCPHVPGPSHHQPKPGGDAGKRGQNAQHSPDCRPACQPAPRLFPQPSALLRQGVYQADLEQIWYRDWIFAVSAAQLGKGGSYATLQIGAYPVVVVKGNDGVIRAFHNVCRHRGQKLCAKPTGSAPRIVCPYHQWTFDLDGKLLYARAMQEGFDPAAHGLKPVHCAVAAGMVFVCLAGEPADFSAVQAAANRYAAPHRLDDLKVAHSSTIIENGNWKLVMENSREGLSLRGFAIQQLCSAVQRRSILWRGRRLSSPVMQGGACPRSLLVAWAALALPDLGQ